MERKKGVVFLITTDKKHLNQSLLQMINEVALQLTVPFEICFLNEKNRLAESILDLATKGSREIIFLPVSLFSTAEISQTLPERVNAILKKEPVLTATFLQPLGSTRAILHFLVDQLAQQPNLLPQPVLLIAADTANSATFYEEGNTLAQKLTIISGRKVYFAGLLGESSYKKLLAQIKTPLLIQLLLTDDDLAAKVTAEIYSLRGKQAMILPSLVESYRLEKAMLERLKKVGCI